MLRKINTMPYLLHFRPQKKSHMTWNSLCPSLILLTSGHHSPKLDVYHPHASYTFMGFPVAQRLKCLPAMQETWVRSLGQEDPLEKEMATHSTILAWRTPWMEEPGGLQSTGSQRVGHNLKANMALLLSLVFMNNCMWIITDGYWTVSDSSRETVGCYY